jgi:glycine hydroxymethyltransferase
MEKVVDFIDQVITSPENDTVINNVKSKVNAMMKTRPIFNA